MRARRAGNAAARAPKLRQATGGRGPPRARRRWQQSYRCLRRAQPVLAPRRQTRPDPAVQAVEVDVQDRRPLITLADPEHDEAVRPVAAAERAGAVLALLS